MPVPSYRVPVRVARGTLAALTAGLADLQEGELCYATDENILYVIEGGVLTPTGTGLTDVEVINDTTPQLGGDLDTNSFQIISTAAGNIQIAPDTTGVTEFRGNTGNDAAIQLNCEANTHGVQIKSPPHSAAASYTLVLPENTGTTGQALTTDGAGVLSWATPSTVGSIDDLTDVDTSSVAPTDGQALVWSTADSEWVPGDVAADLGATSINALSDVDTTTASPTNDQVLAWNGTNWVPADQTGGGGGAVDSVNSQTGVVSLGIQDMDDYELAAPGWIGTWSTGSFATTAGKYNILGNNTDFGFNMVDADGVDFQADIDQYIVDGGSLWYSYNSGSWNEVNYATVTTGTSGAHSYWIWDGVGNFGVGGSVRVSNYDPAAPITPLADGDILQWNNADQKFNPAQLPDTIDKATLKSEVAASSDFADFQSRIAAL